MIYIGWLGCGSPESAVPPSAKELEWALSELRGVSRPDWIRHVRARREAGFSCGELSPAEFLDRLQENLEWLSSHERRLRLQQAVVKLLTLFCLEGD
jgi:hypothetical protein